MTPARRLLRAPVLGAIFALALACGPTISYVDTGLSRAALPAETQVRVYLVGLPAHFEEVGLIEVAGGSQPDRVARAKEEARRRGANAVYLLSSSTAHDTQEDTREVQTKDGDGKVIQTEERPIARSSTREIDRFLAIWIPTP